MRILLTGSSGYVGSALLPKLIAAGHTVVEIDLQWFAQSKTAAPVDCRNLDPSYMGNVDLVIHLAAISNDPSVSFYPRRSWETGTLATMQLADMAWRMGARMIYASSVSVYGSDRGMVTEDMPLKPVSDYNKTKMVAERVLLSYPIRAQIIRPATICGLSPRMRLDLTVNMLTMQALTTGTVTVFGGGQFRPSIHIDDMCDLYLFMINRPDVYGIYNAGFENYSLIQLAQKVKDAIGPSAAITVTPQVDSRSYLVNSDKLMETGFRPPRKTVDDAIAELMAAYGNGSLKDDPAWYNLPWMQSQGIKDD